MILLFPSLIKFKGRGEKEKFDPECHMFYGNRQLDIKDGRPKWTGINGKSELVEDSPVEMVRKRKREIEEEKEKEGEGEKREKI